MRIKANVTTEDINLNSIINDAFHNAKEQLEDNVKASFSKASTPNVQSGQLRDSITSTVIDGRILLGVPDSSPASQYALAQEFGAVITPTNSAYLHFLIEDQDQWVKTKQVILSPRPFLRPALNSNSARIIIDNLRNSFNR
jgi:hypothetical protein